MKKYLFPIVLSMIFLVVISWISFKKHNFVLKIRLLERTYSSSGIQAMQDSFMNQLFRVLHRAEAYWYDLKFNLKKPEHAKYVAVATIDDLSLDVYGKWPWDRHKFDQILKKLYDLGAKTVAFDAVFSEPEISRDYMHLSFVEALPGSEQSYQKMLKLKDDQVSQLIDLIPGIGAQYFSQALRRHPKTVLGYIWQDTKTCKVYNPQDPQWQKITEGKSLDIKEAAAAGYRHVEDLTDNLSAIGGQGIILNSQEAYTRESKVLYPLMSCPIANENALASFASYQGFFNFIPDLDGVFRRYATVFGFAAENLSEDDRAFLPGDSSKWFERATFFSSLGIKALESYWDAKVEPILGKSEEGFTYLKAIKFHRNSASDHQIDVMPDGAIQLNFYGSQSTHEWFGSGPNTSPAPPILQFSLADLELPDVRAPEFAANYDLDPTLPLKDYIVFIGPTSLGVYDIRPSPVQTDMAGVFLHATATARILESAANNSTESGIKNITWAYELALLWVIGFLALVLAGFFPASKAIVFSLLTVLLIFISDYYVFVNNDLRINTIMIIFGFLSVSSIMFLYKYFTEEKDRAFVKAAFEKYVSPKVVDQIVKDPKKLDLGGRKEELTVLFSDIRGFTTISEKLGASELANFLNNYLSPMSDIIMKHEGTIDKYMGDAIMAIFGAPVPLKNHAHNAVDSSLEMLTKLDELQKEWEKQGLPKIDIGIGLNTGEMSVGNMGSKKIFSYTVMGDAVNLGSRLEGINKEYATRLIISASTREKLPPNYLCRQLDRVKVKGKTEPVAIFEVQCVNPSEEQNRKVIQFEQALELYFAKKFTEAQNQFQELTRQGDRTASIFEQRCELFLSNPPPNNWDGTWVMTSK